MGVRHLLVHVNVSEHCLRRLKVAAQLAKVFDAHLTGLFTSAAHDVAFFMMEEIASEFEPTMRGWWMQHRDRMKQEFDAAGRAAGVGADWLEAEGDAGALLTRHARYADLAIVGQADPHELLPRSEYEAPERVVIESGRPTLIVPFGQEVSTVGQRILIAWNGSAQAARAVADALPLLKGAERVTILTVNAEGFSHGKGDRPGDRIAAHLLWHGIKADARDLALGTVAADDAILAQAAEAQADLIVMGAYGHPRESETILGGATRTVMKHAKTAVLMSH